MSRLLAAMGLAIVGYAMVPGCVIRVGPGTGGDDDSAPDGVPVPEEPAPDQSVEEPDQETKTPEELAEEAFMRGDPQELALASTKATFTTYALAGMIESLGLDPATLDEAALGELMTQYMPAAAEEADRWLSTLDPSTLPLGITPRYECTDEFGCAYSTPCKYAAWGTTLPSVKHRCFVTDCGDARCSTCPAWVGELLSHLAIRSWCAYVCLELGVLDGKPIAVGARGLSSLFGGFVGPICMAP
ncbi:hypothetical protein ACSRUE_16170 [Sorangium sp. KYC3313]|uniref:hypothetical protein n=1 Tax=Sorangium sp. KYC3313 TaxID=3449740 RepID=UPI003F8A58FA